MDWAIRNQGCWCRDAGAGMLRQGCWRRDASVGMLAWGCSCRNVGIGMLVQGEWGEYGCEVWLKQWAGVWQCRRRGRWIKHGRRQWDGAYRGYMCSRLAEDQSPCQREERWPNTLHWGLGFNIWIWGENKHSVYSNYFTPPSVPHNPPTSSLFHYQLITLFVISFFKILFCHITYSKIYIF